ncbi:MAG: hypothetical protein FJ320_03520 [SAR202 cluster bacterium]|nr:hypothetical protein [SAR202 cluster bacterium]
MGVTLLLAVGLAYNVVLLLFWHVAQSNSWRTVVIWDRYGEHWIEGGMMYGTLAALLGAVVWRIVGAGRRVWQGRVRGVGRGRIEGLGKRRQEEG